MTNQFDGQLAQDVVVQLGQNEEGEYRWRLRFWQGYDKVVLLDDDGIESLVESIYGITDPRVTEAAHRLARKPLEPEEVQRIMEEITQDDVDAAVEDVEEAAVTAEQHLRHIHVDYREPSLLRAHLINVHGSTLSQFAGTDWVEFHAGLHTE